MNILIFSWCFDLFLFYTESIFFEYIVSNFSDVISSKSSTQLNKSDISAPYPQSRNLIEMNNPQTSNTRPLPPVPHINL